MSREVPTATSRSRESLSTPSSHTSTRIRSNPPPSSVVPVTEVVTAYSLRLQSSLTNCTPVIS